MSPGEMEQCIVRYGDLVPCKTAFIDARTPGSDLKENYCIIGAGISESPTQTVHIRETPGFNIGAAGQPPHCKNSLHYHITAEAFFVLKGRWRFFWGLHGDADEVVLEEGDIFNIPTGIFRGSPHQYIIKRRIDKSITLLSNSDASVKEIAAQLGFHDQPHFTKLFKATTGVSPTFYRKDLQRQFRRFRAEH